MTLLPSDEFGIRGHEGNAYDVPASCSHPDCARPAAHVHHCWPRSYLRGQPYEWVSSDVVFGGPIAIGNRLGFCVEHHEMLTGEIGGYRARLVWESGVMWWEDKMPERTPHNSFTPWARNGPTKHQPPVVKPGEKPAHGHVTEGEEEVCPTCGHHKKKPGRTTPKPGPSKDETAWKDWTARTPDADALDESIENLAIPLGFTEQPLRVKRGLVLLMALAWVEQHRPEFIADVAEAAGRRVRAS